MHSHMEDMDKVISSFHDAVDVATSRWSRYFQHIQLPNTSLGDTIPVSLVIPVTMDCIVDGLLIGISGTINAKAGLVLAIANCLEMSFLGIAYSIRIGKCTGTSSILRYTALYCPPLLMCLSAGCGAILTHLTSSIPIVYISCVSFGIVALLALVCGELLIEARERQEGEVHWYVQLCLFLGVYIVLMMG